MTIRLLSSLVVGILVGVLILPEQSITNVKPFIDGALILLLFSVGFDLGQESGLVAKIKKLPKIALAIPFLVALGTFAGVIVSGLVFRVPPGEASLIGAAFGWYSLSSVIIAQTYDITLGTLTLLANVFREALAIILIPFIAKKLGPLPSIAPGASTTVDVTLPIISRNTDAQTTLIAFYSGAVLSGLVPLLIPLIIKLLKPLA